MINRITRTLLIASLLVSVAHAGDWHQWRGTQRDGNSDETGLPSTWTPGTGGSGNVAWRQATNIGRESETSTSSLDSGSPVVVGVGSNGRVFFMQSVQSRQSSRLVSLREDTGGYLWDYMTSVYGGNGFEVCRDHQGASTPYVDLQNQRVYYGTKEGRLQALDFSGNLVWRRLGQNNVNNEDPNAFNVVIHNCGNSSPIVYGNMVIHSLCPHFGEGENNPKLVALDRNTGSTVWTQSLAPYTRPLLHGSWSIPVIAQTPDGVTRIFLQLADGSLRSVRASDGSQLWTHADDSSYNRTQSNSWHPNGDGSEGVASPVYNPPGTHEVSSGAVYVSAGEDPSHPRSTPVGTGRVWKVNAQTGQKIWHYPTSNNDLGNVIAAVGISDNRLYVGDTFGYLHCINIQDGTRYWRQQLGGGDIWSSATIADGKVYIGTQDGDFYIIEDSSTFNVLDNDNLGSPIASSVAVANGAVYVKSSDYVWKLTGDGGPPPTDPPAPPPHLSIVRD
jgi:outer membrane protein assembly factor BamB